MLERNTIQIDYATDAEMKDILSDKELLKDLKQGDKEIREGKYRILGLISNPCANII